jgi:hypothetical protein
MLRISAGLYFSRAALQMAETGLSALPADLPGARTTCPLN